MARLRFAAPVTSCLLLVGAVATAQVTTPVETDIKADYYEALPGTTITLTGSITKGRDIVTGCYWEDHSTVPNSPAGTKTEADLAALTTTVTMPETGMYYGLYCRYVTPDGVRSTGSYREVKLLTQAELKTPPECWPKPLGEHTWPYVAPVRQGTEYVGACAIWYCPDYSVTPAKWKAPGFCWTWKASTQSAASLLKLTDTDARKLWSAQTWIATPAQEQDIMAQLRYDNYPKYAPPPKPTKVCTVAPNSNPVFTTRPVYPKKPGGALDMTKIVGRVAVGTACDCENRVTDYYSVSGQRTTTGTILPSVSADGTGGAYALCTVKQL